MISQEAYIKMIFGCTYQTISDKSKAYTILTPLGLMAQSKSKKVCPFVEKRVWRYRPPPIAEQKFEINEYEVW